MRPTPEPRLAGRCHDRAPRARTSWARRSTLDDDLATPRVAPRVGALWSADSARRIPAWRTRVTAGGVRALVDHVGEAALLNEDAIRRSLAEAVARGDVLPNIVHLPALAPLLVDRS